jgi:hypothetical protein
MRCIAWKKEIFEFIFDYPHPHRPEKLRKRFSALSPNSEGPHFVYEDSGGPLSQPSKGDQAFRLRAAAK